MVDHLLQQSITWMQTMPAELISFMTFLVCVAAILMGSRYGFTGLCVYNVLAMFVGNIQVLRLGHYALLNHSIALGSVLFATTFLVMNIITEKFGPKRAGQCLLICFVSQLIVALWMILCLGHKGDVSTQQLAITTSLSMVFLPQARFFAASLVAYAIGQLINIALYQWLKNLLHERYSWIRQNIARLVSGLIDNLIFSVLAWIFFNPNPLHWKVVLISYVLAGYGMRAIINVIGTPVMTMAERFLPKKQ